MKLSLGLNSIKSLVFTLVIAGLAFALIMGSASAQLGNIDKPGDKSEKKKEKEKKKRNRNRTTMTMMMTMMTTTMMTTMMMMIRTKSKRPRRVEA